MFNFFRKLFKALNSSGKPWQLSGAIVLAMFSGFLPANSLILFDLLFLALILNVNFGLFLLFSVIFSGVGYLFDPLFESLGYILLTNEALNAFFTSLYNSALFRWSAFNYTLVPGSLIVSAMLTLPAFFILNKFVSLYRDQIGQKLNEWKLTKWMNLFNEEAKSSAVFRWWGLGVFGGLAVVIVLFLVLLFDPIAKMAIEKTLSYTLQTEVSIKGLDSNLNDLSIEVSGVEIADKDKLTHNLVQLDKLAFDLGFLALLEKKVMIEQLDIDALAFDIKRAEVANPYGEASQKKEKSAKSKEVEERKRDDNPFALPDVNDILEKEELRSVKEAQALGKEIKATQEKWAKMSSELKAKDEVSQIQADAKKLQTSLKGADVQKLALAAKDINTLKSKVKQVKEKYTRLQNEFNTDQKEIKEKIHKLKSLPQEDINRLKEKYSLNSSGGANLIGALVDDKLGIYMQMVLKYYEMLRPYLNDAAAEQPEDIKPPRGEGRWIRYANQSRVPDLLIKKANVNLQLTKDEIDIEIKDLSSNQKLYAKPMVLSADAKGSLYQHIRMDILDDRREDKGVTDFDIKVKGLKKDIYDLDTLKMKDILADGSIKGQLIEHVISAHSDIKVRQAKLQMPSQKLVNNLLSSVSRFSLKIDIQGEVNKPSIKVNSDLDKQLSKGLKSMASRETKKFESDLRSGVLNKASRSSEDLNSELGGSGSFLESKQDALSNINLDFSASSNPLKGILSF